MYFGDLKKVHCHYLKNISSQEENMYSVKLPFKCFFGGLMEFNSKLRKILNGGNLMLRYWHGLFETEF
jgi:hypothetical protein